MVRATAEPRLLGLSLTRSFLQQRLLQALREETAAVQEAAPAAKTCRYFTNLNPRTTSVVKARFGSRARTAGLPAVGRGQRVHHPQQPSTSIAASPQLWALLVSSPLGQGHSTSSITAPVPWYPDSRSCLQPAPPLAGSCRSSCSALKTTAGHPPRGC